MSRSAPRRAAALLLAATLLASGGAAAPASAAEEGSHGIQWRDAEAPDGYFRIKFPGAPQAFDDPSETEAGHQGRTIGVRGNVAAAFGGANTFVASCIVAPDDDRSAQDRIKGVIERWESRIILQYRKPIELQGAPGVEFQFADDVKVLRSRVYAFPDRTCTVLVYWKPYSKPSEADLTTFFDSFKLTSR